MYYGSDPETLDRRNETVCSRFLKFTWKTITFFFSHITLVSMVVSYCILGAVTFEKLEKENEITVKKNISSIRHHIMDKLWNITYHGEEVLKEDTFINSSIDILNDFEQELIKAIKNHGWDGNEDLNKVQWNFAGSLFYSIIVITTIGYGHIAPKTQLGKVVTIVYAILGIPLMLLCLSNIGDIMATSFRFLYWKVCCYVCTKKPKKPKRSRSTRSVPRTPNRTWRSRTASFRRSARTSTRSQDSGFGRSEFASTSHSDTELRYHDEMPRLRSSPSEVYRHQQQHQNRPNSSTGIERSSHHSKYSEATTACVNISGNISGNITGNISGNIAGNIAGNISGNRGGSLDRRKMQGASSRNLEAMVDSSNVEKTSVYCNRYAMEKMDHTKKFSRPKLPSPTHGRRAISMPRTQYHLELPNNSPTSSLYHERVDGAEDSSIKSINTLTTRQKKKKPTYHPSPAIMSPLGYGHRSKYLDDPVSDDDYPTDNDYYDAERVRTRPVPIWLCVFLVISYIIAGTFLFAHWESWSYLNSAYFCFITLTTIGFGDLFPSQRVEDLSGYKQNIAFCSLYLLFGIALLAMSFNLVQEEVIANVKKVAKTLGIIKPDDDDDDDDE